MSTTNTDAVSIIVTLLGCGLAIYGIVSEPLVVDSTRPTQTGEAGKVPPEVNRLRVSPLSGCQMPISGRNNHSLQFEGSMRLFKNSR
jgi:hypothetical protein